MKIIKKIEVKIIFRLKTILIKKYLQVILILPLTANIPTSKITTSQGSFNNKVK